MGFVNSDGKYITTDDFSSDIPSNSAKGISTEHGSWTYPLWPQMNLQGSPLTPYIYDSRVSIEQITNGLVHWYSAGKEERERCGLEGREWAINEGFTAVGMCNEFKSSIETCFDNFICQYIRIRHQARMMCTKSNDACSS